VCVCTHTVCVQVRSRDAPQRWPLAATTADDMDTINNVQTSHVHTTPTQTPTTTMNRPTTTPIPSPHQDDNKTEHKKEEGKRRVETQKVVKQNAEPVPVPVQKSEKVEQVSKAPVVATKAPEPVDEWKEVKTRRPRKQSSQYYNGMTDYSYALIAFFILQQHQHSDKMRTLITIRW
jgi:hypothetical protein